MAIGLGLIWKGRFISATDLLPSRGAGLLFLLMLGVDVFQPKSLPGKKTSERDPTWASRTVANLVRRLDPGSSWLDSPSSFTVGVLCKGAWYQSISSPNLDTPRLPEVSTLVGGACRAVARWTAGRPGSGGMERWSEAVHSRPPKRWMDSIQTSPKLRYAARVDRFDQDKS